MYSSRSISEPPWSELSLLGYTPGNSSQTRLRPPLQGLKSRSVCALPAGVCLSQGTSDQLELQRLCKSSNRFLSLSGLSQVLPVRHEMAGFKLWWTTAGASCFTRAHSLTHGLAVLRGVGKTPACKPLHGISVTQKSQDFCWSLWKGLAANWPDIRRFDSSNGNLRAYKGLLAGPPNGH